ncbi:MAG TPA: hypothetical protein DCP97_00915 [Ruminococcaceae bacterium]|nr:hypothetical protein [Oscillospiraceae bacterium]
MIINFNKFTGLSSKPIDNSQPSRKSVKAAQASAADNVDKVDISSSYKSFDINSLKSQIAASAERNASPERLSELKQKIENGSYEVPSGEIAAALLGYGIKP